MNPERPPRSHFQCNRILQALLQARAWALLQPNPDTAGREGGTDSVGQGFIGNGSI